MILRVLHTFFFYLITVISFFIGTAIVLACSLFDKNKTAVFQLGARYWGRLLFFFSGIKVTTRNFENIPRNQPLVLVANHQGAADIPLMFTFLPVFFRFAIKKELFSIPIFGWYLKNSGYFSVDRETVLSAYGTLGKVIEILNAGESVLFFPEGTRSRDGSLGKFKRGFLMAALKAGAPIVPIAISGSYNIMPRGTYLLNPAPVKLSAGRPIYIKNESEYDSKLEEVRQSIAARL